jgi:hypothetical protein
MKTEFTLSDRIIPPTCHKNYYNLREEDVKEFIRLVITLIYELDSISTRERKLLTYHIDKLAGDKLK